MGKAVYVAGTDTGVGKTHLATALCRTLRERGFTVGVFKPAESGCEDPRRPADALALIEASGCRAPLDQVCPYRFAEPLAPGIAAERSGVTIDPQRLHTCLEQLRAEHQVVVCEGAGGLLVPLTNGLLNVDWLSRESLPVLLVGRLGLGTVNHTLLSVRCLLGHNIHLLATVLSATEAQSSVAEHTNPAVLGRYPEVRLAGVLPHGAPALPDCVVEPVLRGLQLA
jgi:dethiobiotin synthetase